MNSPHKGPEMRTLISPFKLLNKNFNAWWFDDTQPLCDVIVIIYIYIFIYTYMPSFKVKGSFSSLRGFTDEFWTPFYPLKIYNLLEILHRFHCTGYQWHILCNKLLKKLVGILGLFWRRTGWRPRITYFQWNSNRDWPGKTLKGDVKIGKGDQEPKTYPMPKYPMYIASTKYILFIFPFVFIIIFGIVCYRSVCVYRIGYLYINK